MLTALATLVAAATLTVQSPAPARWDITAAKNAAPMSQHVDVVLKNVGRAKMFWHLMELPPWASCYFDPAHPELGSLFSGVIEPGKVATVRVDLGGIPSSYVSGTYVWDIAFLADGSIAPETIVECSLTIPESP